MPCIVRNPENGETRIESGFHKDAIKIKIYEGHTGEESITPSDPKWVKLDVIPVLAISKIKTIGLAKAAPARVYFRDESMAEGVYTHIITTAGNNMLVKQDGSEDKLSDGGALANQLMVAYLSDKSAADYFGVGQGAVDAALEEFKKRYIKEDVVDFPQETIDKMQETLNSLDG